MTIKDYGEFLKTNSTVDSYSGCWLWNKTKTSFGHGMATRRDTGKSGLAHRESYKFFVGDIPDGQQVNHKCDNPSCINPDHLYLGNQKQNIADISTRNRWPTRSGDNSPSAKLLLSDVEYIKSFPKYWGSQQHLANMYSVSRTTICDILNGRTWK